MSRIKEYKLEQASGILFREVISRKGPDQVQVYADKYRDIILAYEDNIKLRIQSSIQVNKLPLFQELKDDFIAHKDIVIPYLVSCMLIRDIMAEEIFKIIQNETGNGEIFLFEDTVDNNETLYKDFIALGAGQGSMAVLNACHWLESEEAKDFSLAPNILNSQVNDICDVNNLLGISNNFLNCSNNVD